MGNPAGVRRDFDALEKRRFQAIRLFERGENQSAIARQVKVVRQTVARWVQQYRGRGKSALRKAGRAGRKPRLNQKDRSACGPCCSEVLKGWAMKPRCGPARAWRT